MVVALPKDSQTKTEASYKPQEYQADYAKTTKKSIP